MTPNGMIQVGLCLLLLLLAVKPLGRFIGRVFQREATFLDPVFGPVERIIYRIARIDPSEEMGWKENAIALLLFNFSGLVVVYLLQRFQGILPLNPQSFGAVSPDSSFNTA